MSSSWSVRRRFYFEELLALTTGTASDDLGEDEVVGEWFSCEATQTLQAPKLWWPYLMSEQPGHLYQLRISVISIKHGVDEYSLPVGLREVTWSNSSFMINHQPFYFR